jgi:hypothetical protein
MLNSNRPQPPTYLSPEHRHFFLLKISSLILFIVLLLITIASSYYIFQNVFDALQSAKQSLDPNNINIEVINFEKLDRIEKNWKTKAEINVINLNHDPFAPLLEVKNQKS